ncbi:hypothetical protein QQY24_06540 [Streptomyces sp. TG1A-8]|uniref:hypothetical protein n=1 Tax=Streptomyces sp. TG1A-8 TaxID=3051385 RepID=UPI00265BD0AB|nr:hypothetical protein [Streptomyces sp. TG1A-8]MDO0925093.1 hypothetical protein [Streptomyces sp. TG1A-8]
MSTGADAPGRTGRAPAHTAAGPRDPAVRLSRVLGRLLGAGRPPADGGSTTAHDLAVRRRLLLALSALLTVTLFLSYEGVHGDAGPLRSSTTPAVVALDTALYALGRAHADATGPTPSASEFQKQVSVAAQSVALAATDEVGGRAGRQALQTVAGLITGYSAWVSRAQLQPVGSVLRDAYLKYASSMLEADGSGIEARLRVLRGQQRAAMARQTSFGWPLRLGWSVAALLVLALGAALVETQLFLRRRFRRRYNRRLIGALAVLAVGFVTLVVFTVRTRQGMTDTYGLLDRSPTGRAAITEARRHTAAYLAGTGFRAAASVWIVIGGALLMALAETGLRQHVDDYRFTPR